MMSLPRRFLPATHYLSAFEAAARTGFVQDVALVRGRRTGEAHAPAEPKGKRTSSREIPMPVM